ncbi:hypothetical protein ONZ45_g983 [Pleurotus djamor]|nr:hypothetical protein ONZ45_g983 [Pleurotus djamor]
MALNSGLANSLESSIGPASEPIALRTFIRSDVSTLRAADLPSSQEDIAQECDVSDIQESIQNTWDNIKQSGHLLKDHEVFVTNAIIAADSKRKRRRIINYDEPTQQPSDLKELQDSLALASKRLKSFPYPPEAALFMRAPKNSDFNVLMQVRPSLNSEKRSTPGAILKITIHNPLSWGHNYLSRASTHLLHSSNTLEELFDLLLCPTNEIPEETDEDNEVEERSQVDPSYVICVEGLAYPGGPSTPDYADLLIEHNNLLAQETRPILVKASSSAPDTKFKSLTLKLNEAYYILHHGNCEHYFVVEEIRYAR